VRAQRSATRRRFLGGAAVAGVAGAVWADRSGEAARVWRRITGGCVGPDGPVPPAPEQDPVTGRFRSRHVPDDDVGFMVWRPGGLSAFGGLPVLVVLPGRGSTARCSLPSATRLAGRAWRSRARPCGRLSRRLGRRRVRRAGDYARNDVFAGASRLDRTPVWVGCGRSDPFYGDARRFAAARPAAHTHWAEGGHDVCLWRLIAPQQVAFAVAALRA